MSKFKYFELNEFIRSDVAKEKGIDNTPPFEVVNHLEELVEKILEPLRAAWGKAIYVRSGYRCNLLNTAVGGSFTSVHKLGYAADLQSGDFEKFRDFVLDWFIKTGTKFDQLIVEKDSAGHRWIHIGLYNNSGQQRGQIKEMNK